jgi:RNA polymerase sigma factor (sigma-70 family)
VQADAQSASALRPDPARVRFADTPALTAALRAGDEAAFRWLHEHWHARLARYCFALARGDATLAAEIAQATYLRVVRHIRVLPDDDALWSWLACAARSAATDLGRTGGRYRGALARFSEWLQPENPADTSAETESQLLAALDTALGQLTAEERDLIADRYFDRVPLEQTAARLNTSARAIEGRLARTRQHLRDLIATELRAGGLQPPLRGATPDGGCKPPAPRLL